VRPEENAGRGLERHAGDGMRTGSAGCDGENAFGATERHCLQTRYRVVETPGRLFIVK
jgi:hypothetical protein